MNAKKEEKVLPISKKFGVLTMEVLSVTPEIAEAWLEKNHPNNRHTSEKLILEYAQDMEDGNWRLTHQGIAFDNEGRLIDGQHRLKAVTVAKVSITFSVFHYNNLPQVLSLLDSGRKRTSANALEIEGAVARGAGQRVSSTSVALYCGLLKNTVQPSRGKIFSVYHAHKEGIDFTVANVPQRFSAPVRAAIAYAYPTNREKVSAFMEKLSTRIGMEEHSPELMLDAELEKKKTEGRDQRNRLFYVTLRCIQASIKGEKIRKLQGSRSGDEETPLAYDYFNKKRLALGLIITPIGETELKL